MDRAKIEGIIDAIESETLQPHPSHSNLARLTAMALRELIGPKIEEQKPVSETTSTNTQTVVETPKTTKSKPASAHKHRK